MSHLNKDFLSAGAAPTLCQPIDRQASAPSIATSTGPRDADIGAAVTTEFALGWRALADAYVPPAAEDSGRSTDDDRRQSDTVVRRRCDVLERQLGTYRGRQIVGWLDDLKTPFPDPAGQAVAGSLER